MFGREWVCVVNVFKERKREKGMAAVCGCVGVCECVFVYLCACACVCVLSLVVIFTSSWNLLGMKIKQDELETLL